jgi:hypothetical protein
VNVVADQRDGLAWVLENRALIDAKRPNGRRRFAWQNLTAEQPKPLDIRPFHPQFEAKLAMSELRRLYELRLSAWGGKGAKGSKKLATLTFINKHITIKVSGTEDFTINCGEIAERVSLECRARDLYLLARMLIDQPTEWLDIRGDDAGLLAFAWKDAVGEYTIYQPAADGDGRLHSRCLAPLRLGKAEAGEREAPPA